MEQNQRNKDLLHAELLLNQSRWAEAEKAFSKLATVHYQDDGDMQYYWAFSVFRQERTDEAEAMTLTALKRFPNVVPLHILLGQIKLGRQETWFAIRHFEDALRIAPNNCDAMSNLAIALSRVDLHHKALASVRKALRIDPKNKFALVVQAEILRQMSRNDEANAVLENSIKQHPEDANSHAVLAHNAYDGGDYQKAAQHFREALRLNPNQTHVRDAVLVSLQKGYTFLDIFTKRLSQWGITDLLIFILLIVLLGWVTIPLYFSLPLAANDITEVLITMKRENKFLVSPQRMRGLMLARIPFAVMILSLVFAVLSRFIPFGLYIPSLSFLMFCLSFPVISATALTFVKPAGIVWTIATVCCASFIVFIHLNGGKELVLALILFFTIGFYRFRYIEWGEASE